MKILTQCLLLCIVLCPGSRAAELRFDAPLRLNHIQVIGTHNSYHKRPKTLEIANLITSATKGWDYAHAPLDQQLDDGVRSFELDIHNTADGWAVYHLPVIDAETTCPTFRGCLELVRAWSQAHPRHVPISFLIEYKDEGRLVDTRIRALDAASLDRLDEDVRAVFPAESLITPDEVRGEFATLEEAVLQRGWPTLDSARGKVFFILHEQGENRELYLKDHPSLQGRAMFIRSEPGRPEAATLVRDNPFSEGLDDLARKGYWIRSTGGGPPKDPAQGSPKRERALASGAHIISSDYPPGHANDPADYVVGLPGNAPARCNPVTAPAGCVDAEIAAE